MGGFTRDLGSYLRLSEDWEQTLETSLPLLKSRSFDGRIILGEWTHLKRLQDNWPTEERISLLRAVASYAIWDDTDLEKDKDRLPFANTIELNISDYLGFKNYPERELVVAHNGYIYQMEKANWLGLNPRVGFDMRWQPVEGNLFSWKNKDNQLVVESIYWQDGNFDSNSRHDNVEVGYGWLVLITEDGYQEMRRRYGVISRGGVIRRNLGQFGLIARKTFSSELETL